MASYFEQLREIVENARRDGLTKGDILDLKPKEFDDLGFASVLPRALEGMHDALDAEEGC